MPSLVEKPTLETHGREEGMGEAASFRGTSSLRQLGEGLLTSAERDCAPVLSHLGEPRTGLRSAAYHPAGSPKGCGYPHRRARGRQ